MNEHDDEPVLIYVTFETRSEAEEVAHTLVAARLVACVNILPDMLSIYEWQGQISRASEVVALFKTRQALAAQVKSEIRSLHSYETPAILVIPTAGGDAGYCEWIRAVTSMSTEVG